jgi:hypothetical protein
MTGATAGIHLRGALDSTKISVRNSGTDHADRALRPLALSPFFLLKLTRMGNRPAPVHPVDAE